MKASTPVEGHGRASLLRQQKGEGMFGLGLTELVVILIVALIVFGPGKLPQVGKALGNGIREFRNAAKGIAEDDDDDEEFPPTDPPKLAG